MVIFGHFDHLIADLRSVFGQKFFRDREIGVSFFKAKKLRFFGHLVMEKVLVKIWSKISGSCWQLFSNFLILAKKTPKMAIFGSFYLPLVQDFGTFFDFFFQIWDGGKLTQKCSKRKSHIKRNLGCAKVGREVWWLFAILWGNGK